VKFCILHFGQLNVVGSGQKFVWGPREIPQHDYRRKKVKNCNLTKKKCD
jgi:hypothetical protein